MHISLLLVGAHSGVKTRATVLQAAEKGRVILIEPVPFLFARLSQTYADHPNITCLNRCVAPDPGKVKFFAPVEGSNAIFPWADQLGSLNADHAVRHMAALANHVAEIEVDAVTFPQLVTQYEITSLDLLFTDTEGYDTRLLPLFPFDQVMPNQIVFEHKHADGVSNLGRNLGRLFILLDELGYNIQMIDPENCRATRRQPA